MDLRIGLTTTFADVLESVAADGRAADRRIVAELRELQGVATVTIEVIRAADPDAIEASPFAMQLVKATYDALNVQAKLAFEDTLNARFPAGAYNPSR